MSLASQAITNIYGQWTLHNILIEQFSCKCNVATSDSRYTSINDYDLVDETTYRRSIPLFN